MPPRRVVALLAPSVLLAALLVAPSPSYAAPAKANIAGDWRGAVRGDDGPSGYSATVHLDRKGRGWSGQVSYRGVGSASWRYRGKEKGWFTFRESFVFGGRAEGASRTKVQVKRAGAKLKVRWLGSEGQVLGRLDARRVRG